MRTGSHRHLGQGPVAIGAFLRDREVRRGVPLRLVPTGANGRPPFGYYLPNSKNRHRAAARAVRPHARRRPVSAITWFADNQRLPQFGVPRTLR
jgi:hypothetical protein